MLHIQSQNPDSEPGTAEELEAAGVAPVLVLPGAGSIDGEIGRILSALGIDWDYGTTGRAAIHRASAQALACIIAPIMLEDMSTTALIDAIQHSAPGLAVIVVLDDADVPAAVAVMQSGAHAVVDSRALSAGLVPTLRTLLREPR